MTTPVERLLTDWIDARSRVIWETSGGIESATRELLAEAEARCPDLGITWDARLIPDTTRHWLDLWDANRDA